MNKKVMLLIWLALALLSGDAAAHPFMEVAVNAFHEVFNSKDFPGMTSSRSGVVAFAWVEEDGDSATDPVMLTSGTSLDGILEFDGISWSKESGPISAAFEKQYTFRSGNNTQSLEIPRGGLQSVPVVTEVNVTGDIITWKAVKGAKRHLVFIHPLDDRGNPQRGKVLNNNGYFVSDTYRIPREFPGGEYAVAIYAVAIYTVAVHPIEGTPLNYSAYFFKYSRP